MVAKRRGDVEGLLRANQAVARLLVELAALAKPGVRTAELDAYAREYIANLGGEPVFYTEKGFPGAINASVNDAVLHGVPNETVLRDGDVLSIDVGMRLDGYCGDSCVTLAIGEIAADKQRLLEVARGARDAGIAAAVVGNRIGDIGYAMQHHAERHGFAVMREFTGHGVGRKMHEAPSVPFVGRPRTGQPLLEGLVITIEPVVVERSFAWKLDPDGWTVRTVDGGWGAQFEHTVIVGPRRARVLSAA
jgi:methionyl aminopeptidase